MFASIQNIGRGRVLAALVALIIAGLLVAQDSTGVGWPTVGTTQHASVPPTQNAEGTWSASVATPEEQQAAEEARIAREGVSGEQIIGQFSGIAETRNAEIVAAEQAALQRAASQQATASAGANRAAGQDGDFVVVTKDLPKDYVSGAPPTADLAAKLRRSQSRFAQAQLPAPLQAASAIATNAKVIYTRQSQVQDILSGGVDPRVIDMMTWIVNRRQSITITSVKTDHSMCVAGSNPCRVSAHKMGRAIDIAAVDGEACVGTTTGKCGVLYQEIVAATRGTQYQPSQIIYGFDLWPSESWNFAMGNHNDHIHLAY